MVKNGSPFVINDPVIPPIFAGRRKEIEFIKEALIKDKESIVIYGNDAIGKSSLISTVYTNFIAGEKEILPVRINAFDFVKAVENDFLGMVTHQVCAAIWTKVFKRSYSELLEDTLLFVSGDDYVKREEEKTLRRIFRIICSQKLTGSGKINSEYGAKFYAHVKQSETNEIINERKPLAPFEFMHLLDELIDIIRQFGFSKIVVFCDELNHFPIETNTEILRNYLSVFSSQKIQFVLIVVNPEHHSEQDALRVIESFYYKLEVGTFVSVAEIAELIDNSLASINSSIAFRKGCADVLNEITRGHPWWIQKVCNVAYESALSQERTEVDDKQLHDAAHQFLPEIQLYNDRVRAGLPFRKFHLKGIIR